MVHTTVYHSNDYLIPRYIPQNPPLYDRHISKCTAHRSFQRLTEEELEADPLVTAMREETEEGKKVARNGGSKYYAVFRRLLSSEEPSPAIESLFS